MTTWLSSTYIVNSIWRARELRASKYSKKIGIKVNQQHNNSDQEHASVPCMIPLGSKHYPRRPTKRHGRFCSAKA